MLIVGSDITDSVGDSYRRTLEKHYEVRLFNPESPTGRSPSRDQGRAVWPRTVFARLSSLVLRDALAMSFPSLERTARDFAPDVVLTTHMAHLPPRVVSKLRAGNSNAVVLGVFSDHMASFLRGYFFIADYNALFFKDRHIVELLRTKLGWRHVYYLPQACDPTLHHPVALTEADRARYGCDLTLAGNMYLYRAARLAPLANRDFKFWGTPPSRWLDHPITKIMQGHVVSGEEKCKAMTAAKIVLNDNHYAEVAGTNKRTFEVAAIGAFQLTDTPALTDVFDPETEVARFDSMADMLERIDHYLARPELRQTMAKRACDRAHREHTYAHRWVAKMMALGFDVPPSFPIQPGDVTFLAQ